MAVYPIRRAHALRHPDHGELVVPEPGKPYDEEDPLVRAFPWAFCTGDELASADATAELITEVPIERADARPGSKRRTPRRR